MTYSFKQSIKERRKAAVLSGIEMFRQLSGNECALLSCFHSLDGHYRSMGQALARGEGNQRAVQRRLSGSQQQKGAERDKPTKKHRLACVFHFQKPLGVR